MFAMVSEIDWAVISAQRTELSKNSELNQRGICGFVRDCHLELGYPNISGSFGGKCYTLKATHLTMGWGPAYKANYITGGGIFAYKAAYITEGGVLAHNSQWP